MQVQQELQAQSVQPARQVIREKGDAGADLELQDRGDQQDLQACEDDRDHKDLKALGVCIPEIA